MTALAAPSVIFTNRGSGSRLASSLYVRLRRRKLSEGQQEGRRDIAAQLLGVEEDGVSAEAARTLGSVRSASSPG